MFAVVFLVLLLELCDDVFSSADFAHEFLKILICEIVVSFRTTHNFFQRYSLCKFGFAHALDILFTL